MIYTIHMRPDAEPHARDTDGITVFDSLTAVPESVAKWALFFPPLWLAYHKLWWAFATYCLLAVLGIGLLLTPFWVVAILLGGLPGIYLFLEGNQLRREALQAKGIDMAAVIEAGNEKIALARFVAGWHPPKQHKSPDLPVLKKQTVTPSFGMFPQGEG